MDGAPADAREAWRARCEVHRLRNDGQTLELDSTTRPAPRGRIQTAEQTLVCPSRPRQ
jgi:hypothetical protein